MRETNFIKTQCEDDAEVKFFVKSSGTRKTSQSWQLSSPSPSSTMDSTTWPCSAWTRTNSDKFLYSVLDRGRMTKAAPNEEEKSTVVKGRN